MKSGKYICTTIPGELPNLKLGQEYIIRRGQSYVHPDLHFMVSGNGNQPRFSIYKENSNSCLGYIERTEAPKYFEESHKAFNDKLQGLLDE